MGFGGNQMYPPTQNTTLASNKFETVNFKSGQYLSIVSWCASVRKVQKWKGSPVKARLPGAWMLLLLSRLTRPVVESNFRSPLLDPQLRKKLLEQANLLFYIHKMPQAMNSHFLLGKSSWFLLPFNFSKKLKGCITYHLKNIIIM